MIYLLRILQRPYLSNFFELQQRSLNDWTSKNIRSAFIDFYLQKDHKYIPSSPVVPWNDRTLEFVNAGMNQFKPILFGTPELYFGSEEHLKSAVNSQKCIRVGGKHNDLSAVGQDGHHQTFFEMLGSWSFGDYLKKDACTMAWQLLTDVYKIPQEHLYVTYFGGDPSLGISADEEVKHIWGSLGIAPHRILPFGMKENFWEMGAVGPCGLSTEIHYEYKPSLNGASLVNRGSPSLVELWNLVFIQFQRIEDGSLQPLPLNHVDTGMGLERLTAILNGKESNYDTDLFCPLFDCIQKLSGRPNYSGTFGTSSLDTAYRIIADHARMVCISLADGFLPQDSYILRKSIRRILTLGRDEFGLGCQKYWLCKLFDVILESLGDTYPELKRNSSVIKSLLHYEEDIFDDLLMQISKDWQKITLQHPKLKPISHSLSLNLIDGLKTILAKEQRDSHQDFFCLDDAIKLNKKCQAPPHVVEEIIKLLGFKFNSSLFYKAINKSSNRSESPSSHLISRKNFSNLVTNEVIDRTVYDPYNYEFDPLKNKYTLASIRAKVLSIVSQNSHRSSAEEGQDVSVIVDRTNFYYESGGQEGDIGVMESGESVLNVKKVYKDEGYVIHAGKVTSGTLSINDEVALKVQASRRLSSSAHHSVQHLFMGALRAVAGSVFQQSSSITESGLVLSIFSHPPLHLSQIALAERIVQGWIRENCAIDRCTLPFTSALREEKLSLLPGACYPYQVHMVTSSPYALPSELASSLANDVGSVDSCELCCGSHLFNTSHLKDFAITNIEFKEHGRRTIHGLCGTNATKLNAQTSSLFSQVADWEQTVNDALAKNERVKGLNRSLLKWKTSFKKSSLPFTAYRMAMLQVNHLEERLSRVLYQKSNWKQLLEEYRRVISRTPSGPIVHLMPIEYSGSQANLEAVIRESRDRPSLFVCRGWGKVRVMALIPQMYCQDTPTTPLETLLKEIVEKIGRGLLKVRQEEDYEIGDLFMDGVKVVQIEGIISDIITTSEEYFSKL